MSYNQFSPYHAAARRGAVQGCNNDKKRALAREGVEDFDNTPWFFLTFAVFVALAMSDCIKALPTDVPNLKS